MDEEITPTQDDTLEISPTTLLMWILGVLAAVFAMIAVQ